MLKWIAVLLTLLLQTAAYAGPLEDCEQDQDIDLRIRGCTERIRQFPSDAAAYFRRGEAYMSQGELDRAIADTSRVVQIDGWYAAAYFTRGMAYERKEQYDRAIADYGKTIEINPRHAGAHSARAVVYIRTGQPALALRDAERAVNLEPYEVDIVATRGRIYEALGRRDDAIADYRQVLAADPSAQVALDGLRRLGASSSSKAALPR
jgi:tetratricopeptide (TPR) repeat protein